MDEHRGPDQHKLLAGPSALSYRAFKVSYLNLHSFCHRQVTLGTEKVETHLMAWRFLHKPHAGTVRKKSSLEQNDSPILEN